MRIKRLLTAGGYEMTRALDEEDAPAPRA